MAIHHITSDHGSFTHPDAPGIPGEPGLLAALDATPQGEPIVLMVHGYRYAPKRGPGASPHTTLYANHNALTHWKYRSWPEGLGLSGDYGLAIGYGWNAACQFKNPRRDLRHLYARAGDEGRELARLLHIIHTHAPDRPVDIIAHSMGARVVLTAMRTLDVPVMRRVILMGGTEYAREAKEALNSLAGRFARVFNITAHQNRMYDMLFRLSGPLNRMPERLISAGVNAAPAQWMDICVDSPRTERALGDFGMALAPAKRGFCHWSFYTRAGIFTLYQNLLKCHPQTLAVFQTRIGGTSYDGAFKGIVGTIWQAAYTFGRWAYSSSFNP